MSKCEHGLTSRECYVCMSPMRGEQVGSMDRDTIIRLAREAGYGDAMADLHAPALERFAELVLANEAKQAQVSDAFAKALGQVDAHLANVDARIKTVKDAVLAEREKVARWMMERGYATGHGDTIEDLLHELEWQLKEKA